VPRRSAMQFEPANANSIADFSVIEHLVIDRYIRYSSYRINLCLNTFLFASSKEALLAAIKEESKEENRLVATALHSAL
jgi:hypothetical protein